MRPAATRSAATSMARAHRRGNTPSAALARAAAFLIRAYARISAACGGRPVRRKVSRARWGEDPIERAQGNGLRAEAVTLSAHRTMSELRRELFGRLPHLEAVSIALGAGDQAGPLAVATEVPRLETLAVICSARRDHLRDIAGHQHETPAAGRRTLHVDVDDVLHLHGTFDPFPAGASAPIAVEEVEGKRDATYESLEFQTFGRSRVET